MTVSEPVTVAITRHVDPDHEQQMLAWLRAGTQLSERFDGFLGSGWVRPAPGSTEWHMLYRFDSAEHLRAWDESEQRRWWLEAAEGFVEEARHERRTGIEGWFDEPSSVDVQDLRPPPTAPPRWKQMCAIFCVFLPLSIAANWSASRLLPDVVLPLRVLVSVLVMTPVMTYVALPFITRLLAPWLNAPPRRTSAGGGR